MHTSIFFEETTTSPDSSGYPFWAFGSTPLDEVNKVIFGTAKKCKK